MGWGGGGRLFEFKWEWEGGRVGWALIRGLALIRGWALNRINTARQKIASERKALVAGWSLLTIPKTKKNWEQQE